MLVVSLSTGLWGQLRDEVAASLSHAESSEPVRQPVKLCGSGQWNLKSRRSWPRLRQCGWALCVCKSSRGAT